MLEIVALLAAHVGQDQFGKFPFVRDGAVVGGGTSWGVVRPLGEDRWERVCEEAFGAAVFFAVDQGERGVLLGGVDGMSRTTDGGCTYDSIPNELQGEFVTAKWFDPIDANHMMIGTSTNNSLNAVWESFNGGTSFEQLLLPRPNNYADIAVSEDGQRIAVSGNDQDSFTNILLVSDDGGATFEEFNDVVLEATVPHVLLFDGDALLVGGLLPSSQGYVDRVTFAAGQATAERIGVAPREVRSAVIFQGELYVIAASNARGELLKANDSELGFGVVAGGPSDCVFVIDDVLYGCGRQVGLNTSMFLRSTDGSVWTEEMAFFDVSYQLCPEGTVGRELCGSFVELFCGNNIDDDVSGGTDCEDEDCATSPLCFEGEGEEGEGEGEGAEGEGEADVPPAASCCTGSPASGLFGLLLLRRRRR